MQKHYAFLTEGWEATGDIETDALSFLRFHECPKTADHVNAVADEAGRLAERFDVDVASARIGGFLHDISAVIPNRQRVEMADKWNIALLPEERDFAMITHQKLSGGIAQHIFDVQDNAILSAITCHTTLKANYSDLDLVVFVADKIAWDQVGNPPYIDDLLSALDKSLAHGTFVYLQYLYDMRDKLRLWHPDSASAYQALKAIL